MQNFIRYLLFLYKTSKVQVQLAHDGFRTHIINIKKTQKGSKNEHLKNLKKTAALKKFHFSQKALNNFIR